MRQILDHPRWPTMPLAFCAGRQPARKWEKAGRSNLTQRDKPHHELSGKGIRVQAVLPGPTSTEFWNVAGMPVHSLPSEIVMPLGEMVDAALAGLELGEFATIPSLPHIADWDAFEAARQKLLLNLSHAHPAARYRKQSNKQQLPSHDGNSGKRHQ